MEKNPRNSDNKEKRSSDLPQPEVENKELENDASLALIDESTINCSSNKLLDLSIYQDEYRPNDGSADSVTIVEKSCVETVELLEDSTQTICEKEIQEIIQTTRDITPELTQEMSTQTDISGINPAMESLLEYQMAPQTVEYTVPQPSMEQREYILPVQSQYIQPPHNFFMSHPSYHSPHTVDYGLPLTQSAPQYVMQIPPQYGPQYPQPYPIQYHMQLPVPMPLSPQYIPQVQSFPLEQQMPQPVEYAPQMIMVNTTLQQPIAEYNSVSSANVSQQQLQKNLVENVLLMSEMQEQPAYNLQAMPVAAKQPADYLQAMPAAVEQSVDNLQTIPVAVKQPADYLQVTPVAVQQPADYLKAMPAAAEQSADYLQATPVAVKQPADHLQAIPAAAAKQSADHLQAKLVEVEQPADHLRILPVAVRQPPEFNAVQSDEFPVLAKSFHLPKRNNEQEKNSRKRQKSKFVPMEVPINYCQYKPTEQSEKTARPQKSRRGKMELFSDHVSIEKSPDTSEPQTEITNSALKFTQDFSSSLSSQRKVMQNLTKEDFLNTNPGFPIQTAFTESTKQAPRNQISRTPLHYQTCREALRMSRGTRRYYSSRIVWNSERVKGARYRYLLGQHRGPFFRQALNVPYKSPRIHSRKSTLIARPPISTLSTSASQTPKKFLSILPNTQQTQESDPRDFVTVSRTRFISPRESLTGKVGRAITKTSPRDSVPSPIRTLTIVNRFSVLQEDDSETEEDGKQTQQAVETTTEKLTVEESSATVEEGAVTNERILTWYEDAYPEEAFPTTSANLTLATPRHQEDKNEQTCDAVPRSDNPSVPKKIFVPLASSTPSSKPKEFEVERKISWHEEAFPEDVIKNKPTPTTESETPENEAIPTIIKNASTSKIQDLFPKPRPNAVSPLKGESKAPTIKKSEENISKKQTRLKKNDSEKKTKQTTASADIMDQSTAGKVTSRASKNSQTKNCDTLVTLPAASKYLPVISQKVAQDADNDNNEPKKKSRRKRKTKKQTAQLNPSLKTSDPHIFCFGDKKLESGAIPKKPEKSDLNLKPSKPSNIPSSKGKLASNSLRTFQEDANLFFKMAKNLQTDGFQPTMIFTKRRKLAVNDKLTDLTFKTALGINTKDHLKLQKTQSDLPTKSTGAITKRKIKKQQTKKITPKAISSAPALATSERRSSTNPLFTFNKSLSQGIRTNDAAKANGSDEDDELEKKLATTHCTDHQDSDSDEEIRNAKVEAVKVLLNDSFNPDLHLSASEKSTESDDSLWSLKQIQKINAKILTSQDRIEHLFALLEDPYSDTNKVLDELTLIGDEIDVYHQQIKDIKKKIVEKKSESSSGSMSYVTASQQDTPRETSSVFQTPRFTNLPMISAKCNMESRINLLYHLDNSFRPLLNGDITASFLKSWLYRKSCLYKHNTPLVVTPELNMVIRYRNNRTSIPAEIINPKYEDLFHDKHVLELKLIIPYGHTHLDLVVVRNKKKFIITFARMFNEIFYDFETKTMTGFKVDPKPSFVNSLNGSYNYRFIAIERNSNNLFLIATKDATAIFIKLHVNPGFVVHEKYSSSSSRDYKEFFAKTMKLDYVQWEFDYNI